MKGTVVILAFPFSDLSGAKRRPALVVFDWGGSDVILCQITSKAKFDGWEVAFENFDFENGGLPLPSNIRPNKLFTAHKATILSTAGKISNAVYQNVIHQINLLVS